MVCRLIELHFNILERINAIIQFILWLYYHEISQLYLPWIGSVIALVVMSRMITGVRMRKEGVIMVGLFIQLFLPDPYVEYRAKIEQVETKKTKESDDDELISVE